jgi:hypothetical protein
MEPYQRRLAPVRAVVPMIHSFINHVVLMSTLKTANRYRCHKPYASNQRLASWSIQNIFFSFLQRPCYFNSLKKLQKFCIFPKIYKHTSLYSPTASGASVDPTSQVCSPAMFVLPIVGNWYQDFMAVYNGIRPIPNLTQIRPEVL